MGGVTNTSQDQSKTTQQGTVVAADPWGSVVDPARQVLGAAQAYGNNPGATSVQFNPTQQQGFDALTSLLGSGTFGGSIFPYLTGLGNATSSGVTAGMQDPLGILAAIGNGTINNNGGLGQLYGNVLGQASDWGIPQQWLGGAINAAYANGAPTNNLTGLAQNATGALTPTQQAILDDQATRTANRLATLESGNGRYGSFGMNDAIARSIAAANNPLEAQYNQNNIQNAINANQLISGDVLGRLGMINNLSGTAGNLLTQRSGSELGALSGLGNMLQNSVQNELAASNASLGQQNAAQGNAVGWANALPNLFQSALAPNTALLGLGNFMSDWPAHVTQQEAAMMAALAPLIPRTGLLQQNVTGTGVGSTTNNNSLLQNVQGAAQLGSLGLGLFG